MALSQFTQLASVAALSLLTALANAQDDISFTSEQVNNGEGLYREHCMMCHGSTLSNGQFGSPLKGSFFRKTWAGKSLGELMTLAYETMPPDKGKSLPAEQYAEIIVFALSKNKLEAGETPITADFEKLNHIMLPW